VDTDSHRLRDGIKDEFPEVILINRPEELRGDFVSMNKVLLHDVSVEVAPYYLQTHSTNPLLKVETVAEAIEVFLAGLPENDSLFSTTRFQSRLWNQDCQPLNHKLGELLRTQDLEPWYEENSCLYLFQREVFIKTGNRIGRNPTMFVMDQLEAWDIDDESDFQIAEYLLQMKDSG
jgi:CMP-N-acetylneuraminic acid synthetase